MMSKPPHTLTIPAEGNNERCFVYIPLGSGSRVAMRGKFFKIHLIKGTYHYSFKNVSFYRSKELDIHIINILAGAVAVKYVPPTKGQIVISKHIKSIMLKYYFKHDRYEYFMLLSS